VAPPPSVSNYYINHVEIFFHDLLKTFQMKNRQTDLILHPLHIQSFKFRTYVRPDKLCPKNHVITHPSTQPTTQLAQYGAKDC